jgi:hypothetical protein
MKVVALLIFVLVLCMIKLMLFINANLKLIPWGGYDKDKTNSFLFKLSILDGLKMIYFYS